MGRWVLRRKTGDAESTERTEAKNLSAEVLGAVVGKLADKVSELKSLKDEDGG